MNPKFKKSQEKLKAGLQARFGSLAPAEHHHFWEWLFLNYCDSEVGNWGRYNFNSENWIGSDDFWCDYQGEAQEDARNYFEKNFLTDEQKRGILTEYILTTKVKIGCLQKGIERIEHLLK